MNSYLIKDSEVMSLETAIETHEILDTNIDTRSKAMISALLQAINEYSPMALRVMGPLGVELAEIIEREGAAVDS